MKKKNKQPLRLAIETIRHLKNTQLAVVNGGTDSEEGGQSTMYAISCAPCSGTV
jgi:hypothetical protein